MEPPLRLPERRRNHLGECMPASELGQDTRLFALLVGIDNYQHIDGLLGCVNDVEAMRVLLMSRYGVPERRLRVLTNAQATRTDILEAFQEHLIDNPDIRHGDQILFHYSGHGSQMAARPEDYEPDGWSESLVPYDSRLGDGYDIRDKKLAALLDRLATAKGDQITVILDCCHSGSGTRAPEDSSGPRVRRVGADTRIPPVDLDSDLRGGITRSARSTGLAAWAGGRLPYVLLAGCRDGELSYACSRSLAPRLAWGSGLSKYCRVEILQDQRAAVL